MKKILAGTLALAALLVVGTVAFAAATQVMKGTPVIDGKKDAIYSQTISIPLADTLVFAGSSVDWSAAPDNALRGNGVSYLMYDDNYVYVYGEIVDPEVVKNLDATAPEENPWDQDAFENWFDLGDGVFKVTVSPFISYVFATGTDVDPATCKSGWEKTAKGYNAELAFPKAGLTQGGTIFYVLQMNDYTPDGYMICYGSQAPGGFEYTLGAAVK